MGDYKSDFECARSHIEAHLEAHPLAADSAVGVARWWIGSSCGLPLETVEAVLDLLADEGLVTRIVNPDGSVVFAAARR